MGSQNDHTEVVSSLDGDYICSQIDGMDSQI